MLSLLLLLTDVGEALVAMLLVSGFAPMMLLLLVSALRT
jgi:hypothetical protein